MQTHDPYVALVEVDAAVPARYITSALRELIEQPALDGIVFRRRLQRRLGPTPPPLDRLAAACGNLVARTWFGLAVRDVNSPLRVFRRSALGPLFEKLRLYNHGFYTDLLYNAKRARCRIEQRDLPWTVRAARPGIGKIAVATLFTLAGLRLYYSFARTFPIVEFLGARYALPAKRSYKIAIFCARDPLSPKAGGSEVYLYEQAKCWVAAGCSVVWIAERFGGSKTQEVLDGIHIVRRGKGLLVFARAALWHIFESHRDYEFIIDNMNGFPFFTPLYSWKPKVCLIHHLHAAHFREELPRWLAELAVAIETRLVPLVYAKTRFVTVSESTKGEIEAHGITKLPVLLVHNGVPETLVPGRKAPDPTILYLGRVRRYKQLRKLIDSFAQVKRAVPASKLVIAGAGDDLNDLRTYDEQQGVADVTFTGRVDEATKIRLMQEAWVFGMPSKLEGWGIVVVEAAACGTPTVAYDVNGLRDCIIDGYTGYLARDDAEFAERLRALLSADDLRARLSAGARDWSQQFSWARTAERTLAAIRLAQPWRAVFEPDLAGVWKLRVRDGARGAMTDADLPFAPSREESRLLGARDVTVTEFLSVSGSASESATAANSD